MSDAKVREYWSALVRAGCIVAIEDLGRCRAPAEIAHCHGGSIVERTHEPKAKGKKLPRNDWLVLPLCPSHHREPMLGPNEPGACTALDLNVAEWEARYGTQASYIDALCVVYRLDLWGLARGRQSA